MILSMGVAFYLGCALYCAAGAAAILYLWRDHERVLDATIALAGAGAACLAAAFAFRWIAWRLVPMTTAADSIALFAVLSTAVMLALMRKPNVRALACFYAPPLAALCIVNAAVAHTDLFTAPRALAGLPLVLHVGMAFLAYALFFLAGMTSAAYVFQSQRLKRRHPTGLFQRLPSLEQLDSTLIRLIGLGYPLFVLTLILGAFWAHTQRDLLGPRWWLAPKVVLSFVLAIFCAVTYHRRRAGRLRGPRLAYQVFIGFIALLAIYLILALLHLRTYNFWGAAS
ncbi:MAG: cytochrome c biogenesis protein CcsA [Candidatus Hydrogenedentes bacterium]|nr:cytochrome c biogenesis protein CcsA [Candidatus Hydrogenedentota bacterium]